MSARTENPWIQTGTGRALDLMAPTAAMIDLETDVAEALAREPRFGGHVRGGPYSVAQHMVLGADAIVAQTGNMYNGLWYPIIVAGMTFVVGMLFVKETKDVDIYARD